MKIIPINIPNKLASMPCRMDDEDFEKVSSFRWHARSRKGGKNRFYAAGRAKQDREKVYMHRIVMSPPPGKDVDHINGDGLDNRRENLRVCTRSENLRNRGKQANNTTGYKGVHFFKAARLFTASVQYDGKSFHLGYFKTALEAAKAYDEAARKIHGEFAQLNGA